MVQILTNLPFLPVLRLAEVRHSLVPFDYFDAYFSVKALAFNTFYCKS